MHPDRLSKRLVGAALVVLSLGLATDPLAGQGQSAANEGALFLLLPVGAQGVSVGRSMTAIPGAESAFWNPAGLGGLRESRLQVFRGDQVAGESTAVTTIWSNPPIGVFGFSWQLLDSGEVDFTDDQGTVLGRIDLQSHQGIASFATELSSWLRAGVNFKFILEDFDCSGPCEGIGVRSTGWALDAGIQLTSPGGLPIRLGAMVAHLGPDFQVVNASQADPLPTRFRIAGGYDLLSHLEVQDIRLWLNLEVEDRWRDLGDDPSLYLGTELEVGQGDVVFIRSGYVSGSENSVDGFAVGVGLRYEKFELALGKNLAGQITGESEPVHVSFGVVF